MVGICVALHLQKRSRSVVLVDRRGAAEETSFGNAGLIQREGVYPYGFPHDFSALRRYVLNRTIDAYYHASALPGLAPFLTRYWMHSRPARHRAVAQHYSKLIEHCVVEHDALAIEAGATDHLRRKGWLKVFRTERERDKRFEEADRTLREFGVITASSMPGRRDAGADLCPRAVRRIALHRPRHADDPQALALAYLKLFERLGGTFRAGQRADSEPDGAGCRMRTVQRRA